MLSLSRFVYRFPCTQGQFWQQSRSATRMPPVERIQRRCGNNGRLSSFLFGLAGDGRISVPCPHQIVLPWLSVSALGPDRKSPHRIPGAQRRGRISLPYSAWLYRFRTGEGKDIRILLPDNFSFGRVLEVHRLSSLLTALCLKPHLALCPPICSFLSRIVAPSI